MAGVTTASVPKIAPQAAAMSGVSAAALALASCVFVSIVNAQPLRLQGAERGRLIAATPNDNRIRAGRLKDGVLTVRLEARQALWHPEERGGAAVSLFSFAEEGRRATIPGPMLRVPVGTTVHATMRNALPVPMRLRGLQERSGAALDSIVLTPGETRELNFRANVAGTFYYWGRTESFPANSGPGFRRDAMLLGAFVVDSAGATPRADERVLILSVWSDTLAALGVKSERADRVARRELIPRDRWLVLAINGKSWPHTERLSYTVGDTVRWRLINGSRYPHPMHLHGFYFGVDANGDAARDTVHAPSRRRTVVTEWTMPGTTMATTWVPERPGNWLFHCHIVQHVSDATRLGHTRHDHTRRASSRSTNMANHAEQKMAGMVTGIHVAPARRTMRVPDALPRRRLRLFVTERAKVYGDWPGFSYVLQEGPTPPARDSVRPLASTIALRQHEPTEITVFNVTSQTTMVHWHGLELESFFDGVGGWSGWGTRVAPPIAPGDSFVVRLTPPRAGTFMYHTHADEGIQLPSGLYGALVVHPAAASPDTTERL
ncbi:MAG TPA: multicopper oxidase domain-containing protein, partial [Gemmatimonadaceae bacterium]|nr:multicopper oxidase domain-containing protein [Gemmatimonadaceae bacterium]